MPRRHTLKISEIFSSVQGEGLRQGEPTIFVRLAGCNLRCSFCDTKRAWKGGEDRAVEDILDEVGRLRLDFPVDWVCLTGGEPFLQDIGPLASGLKKAGFRVQVETNGTIWRPATFDWITVSPKPPDYRVKPEFKRMAKEVKLVVSRKLIIEAVKKVRGDFPSAVPLLLQPQSNARWSYDKALRLLQESLGAGLSGIRLSVQLHQIYGIR